MTTNGQSEKGLRAVGNTLRPVIWAVALMMAWEGPVMGKGDQLHGYSGMAQLDQDKFVVVHDAKTDEDGPRLGIVKIRKDRPPKYKSLEVEAWNHQDGRSHDLESICALPGRPGEFLMAESGYQRGRFGRLFHIVIEDKKVRVLGVSPLPLLMDNIKKNTGDNFEGLACATHHKKNVLVVLGERGGSAQYPTGVLRWGWFDLMTDALTWPEEGVTGKMVSAPGWWAHPASKRDIGDLYVDSSHVLWAVATEDPGDEGPFRSLIYQVATIGKNPQDPLQLIQDGKPSWIIDGFKIEALSGPAGIVGEGPLSFGTEDENYGGVWRPLFPEVRNP